MTDKKQTKVTASLFPDIPSMLQNNNAASNFNVSKVLSLRRSMWTAGVNVVPVIRFKTKTNVQVMTKPLKAANYSGATGPGDAHNKHPSNFPYVVLTRRG